MARIRVLWLVKGLGLGGAERLLLEVAQRIDGARFDVHVAHVTPGKDALAAALEAAGAAVHDLSGSRGGVLGRLGRVIRLVRGGSFEVVHAHSPLLAAVARLAVATLRTSERPRMLTTEHNVWPQYHPVSRLLNRSTYRWSGDVLAVSEAVRASIPRRLRSRVRTLHHGIDLQAFRTLAAGQSEARRGLGIDDAMIAIGVVANLRAEKDVPLMLRAAARVLEVRSDVVFVHLGGGRLESQVRALHDALALGDRYRLLGARPDARELLAAFDVVAFSSRHEGLPVVAMEAAASALPIVATAAGGLPEIVEHEGSGLIVPIGDERALADAILRLVASEALRHDMGRRAVVRARDYDIGPAVAAIESLYEGKDA